MDDQNWIFYGKLVILPNQNEVELFAKGRRNTKYIFMNLLY